jgi:hypothetical protein
VPSINVCGQKLKPVSLVIGSKVTYDKTSDIFTSSFCNYSARRLKNIFAGFSVEELADGLMPILVPLIKNSLICGDKWAITHDAGTNGKIPGTFRLKFNGDFKEFEAVMEEQELMRANLLEGKSEEADATTHNLRAVFSALLCMTAALRPFIHKLIVQFFDTCKADVDPNAAPGSPLHISQVLHRLASKQRPVDTRQTTDLLSLGRDSPWFKYINGNTEAEESEYSWDVSTVP